MSGLDVMPKVPQNSLRCVTVAKHSSPLGLLWSTWTEYGLYRLNWNPPDPLPLAVQCNEARAQDLQKRLHHYFRTGADSFQDVVLDSSGWSKFAVNVYQRCRDVESGTTATYKQIAQQIGNENASRAVGGAMSRNRILLVIPCHRVISDRGQLRGFSALGGLATKQQLLDLEREGKWPQTLFSSERSGQEK